MSGLFLSVWFFSLLQLDGDQREGIGGDLHVHALLHLDGLLHWSDGLLVEVVLVLGLA